MIYRFRLRIARFRFIRKVLLNQVDLEIFKKKPSARFLIGLFFIGTSYIIGWPLISLLGFLAIYFKEPLLFAIGSPVTYGFSHLVFILGVFIAGKDTVIYMNMFAQWSFSRLMVKLLGTDIVNTIRNQSNLQKSTDQL